MRKVVEKKVREFIKENSELNTSSDYFETLETKLEELIKLSINRCEANDRKTVMARDL